MKFFILLFLSCQLFAQQKAPEVINIYPNLDSIPVNVTRFYIQFSKPIQEMNLLDHIKLSTEEGKNITGVFFENQYELWSPDRTKVTLLVDPGRVKLGLLANNKMGRAFDEGQKYILTVDSLLMDFDDRKLLRSFSKKFTSIQEDRTPPDVSLWEIYLPKADSKEKLLLDFNDKIDHISAQTLIQVFYKNQQVKGKIVLNAQKQKWEFIPNKKWKNGHYQILINHRLEDIANNSIEQVFDHHPKDFKQNQDHYQLDFTLK